MALEWKQEAAVEVVVPANEDDEARVAAEERRVAAEGERRRRWFEENLGPFVFRMPGERPVGA